MLELVLQLVVPESLELYRVCEQLVVIALESFALLNLLALSLVELEPVPPKCSHWLGHAQREMQLVWLLQEQRELLVQALNLVRKYLEELRALVLEEFHLWVHRQLMMRHLPADYFGSRSPTQRGQNLDQLDSAHTFLQRANHLRRSPDLIATLSAPLRSVLNLLLLLLHLREQV